MNKGDLHIVVVDDSKASFTILKTMLKTIGFKKITYFEHPLDYVMYLKQIKEDDIDIVFIDYEMPIMNGLKAVHYTKFKHPNIITVMMTGSQDIKVKEKAIKLGVNEFMNKGIDFPEFAAKMNILANLRFYYYKSKQHQKELEEIVKYKDAQENLAVQKQLKIIEDKISHHFYGQYLIDSFFQPKDILSGDSYSTLQIDDNRFFISIVDGMGKGISASLSSVLTVSFMNYSILKSLEFNDFNYERVVKDTINYAKSIMLDDEALSFAILEIDIKKENIKYLNMGLPPLYIIKNNKLIKIKPNNRPLTQKTEKYEIGLYEDGFDTFLIASDGLFESISQNGYPYFVNYKQNATRYYLLKELLDDFKEKVEVADDDTTIIYIKKDTDRYETIYQNEILLTKENIEEFVNSFENELKDKIDIKIVNKIIFSLNELLLNCYEHSVLKISKNKHEIIQKNEKIEYNGIEKFAHLKILNSNRYIVLDLDDRGDGFDVSKILKSEWFNKYHGRGIKMLKKISDGIYYNQKGNRIKLYFKKEE
jgi:CheY-like chemotaxis protein